MQVLEDLEYTAEHEWIKRRDGGGRIGITDYAQEQLGDVVFVGLPEPGTTLAVGAVMCEVESTKSVGEVYAPFAGTVSAVNEAVRERPELVNQDPYGEGWLVELDGPIEGNLIGAGDYRSLIE